MAKRKCSNDESSGGQHSVGKRPVLLVPRSKAQPSGSQHSAGKRQADENNLSDYLREQELAYDPRPQLEPVEMEKVIVEKNVDVVIKIDSVRRDGISWDFTCTDPWHVVDISAFPLSGRNLATTISLRRLTPYSGYCSGDDKIINLVLMKTVELGNDFGAPKRKLLAFGIFEFLLASAPLTFVLGNIGFPLSSILHYSK